MRTIIPMLALALVISSCGDAGLTFTLSKELPISVPFEVPFPDFPDLGAAAQFLDDLSQDPPAEEINYSLDDVGSFAEYTEGLFEKGGSVALNAISYQIDGVDASENAIQLDEFAIRIRLEDGTILNMLNQTGDPLQNVAKTEMVMSTMDRDQLQNALLNGEAIDANIVFDLARLSASAISELESMSFDFTMYFDATIKTWDLTDEL
ncbi:MAG: hypothetical protein JXQ90_07655 [Cyclobacteriaceae bacterium]